VQRVAAANEAMARGRGSESKSKSKSKRERQPSATIQPKNHKIAVVAAADGLSSRTDWRNAAIRHVRKDMDFGPLGLAPCPCTHTCFCPCTG
jgi:hypothetical protein